MVELIKQIVKKAIAYCRRSSDRKQEESIPGQKKFTEDWCGENKFILNRKYGLAKDGFLYDEGITGSDFKNRPGFQEVLRLCKTEPDDEFKYVLFYHSNRFGRPIDPDEAAYYRWKIKKTGKEIIFINSIYNGEDPGMAAIARAMEDVESGSFLIGLSRDVIRGILLSVSKKHWPGGLPPYGFDLQHIKADGSIRQIIRYIPVSKKPRRYRKVIMDSDHKVIEKIGHEEPLTKRELDHTVLVLSSRERVDVVRMIFEYYCVKGLGKRRIANKLNELSIKAPAGERWNVGTIDEMLQNSVYCGDLAFNRRTFSKFHKIVQGKAVRKTKDEI